MSSAPHPRPRPRTVWNASAGLLVLALGVGLVAREACTTPRSGRQAASPITDTAAERSGAALASASAAEVGVTGAVSPPPAPSSPRAGALATLAWGSGRGQIGSPREKEEGEGNNPLRLTADSAGNVLLLDAENDRLLRLGADGRPAADVRLPVKDPRDLAVAKDGTVLLLDANAPRGSVMLLGPDGKARGSLPLPSGTSESARGLLISGNDVYVESSRGELTRVGDVGGNVDPNPAMAPGRPTRDGRGYLSALIADPDSGRVHVYLVERASLQQRFSRHLQPKLLAEGIFLIDTNVAGTIYIGVTGALPGSAEGAVAAQLLCLEPERGEIIGAVDLPVNVGEEAILDAKALDSGGVVYSVFTKHGLRVERQDCR